MIKREISDKALELSRQFPVVTIMGPRQSGKTTLVQTLFKDYRYYSLEAPDTRMIAIEDPREFLSPVQKEGIILDEVQKVPQLLSYVQIMVDKYRRPGMFILTGSHQPKLHEGISQSLAGRTALLLLLPFSIPEIKNYQQNLNPFELIVKGGFPAVYEENIDSYYFYQAYIQTYIERDVHLLVNIRDLVVFQKFLKLLAGRIGQLANYNSLSDDVGVSTNTIKNWVSVLTASYVIFELPSYSINRRKRVIKAPKIYFMDTGIVAYLLGIHTPEQAERDPLRGNLFENLVIMEIVKSAYNKGIVPELYFYRDLNGNEVDLIIKSGRKLIPVEIKSASTFTPEFTKGIEKFKKIFPDETRAGFVLYNGGEELEFKGTKIRNPLHMEDLWRELTS